MHAFRTWDLRPVVLVPKEGIPSVIRLVGPEVTLSPDLSKRTRLFFERLLEDRSFHTQKKSPDAALEYNILEWGILEGQLWYRRPLSPETLQDHLAKWISPGLSRVLSLSKNLLQELKRWHTHGFIHGHLSLANTVVAESEHVSFIDPGVGLAVVQASKFLGLEDSRSSYDLFTFAPEALQDLCASFASDIWGMGTILQDLFSRVEQEYQLPQEATNRSSGSTHYQPDGRSCEGFVFLPLKELFQSMVDANPARRPVLDYAIKVFDDLFPSYTPSSISSPSPMGDQMMLTPDRQERFPSTSLHKVPSLQRDRSLKNNTKPQFQRPLEDTSKLSLSGRFIRTVKPESLPDPQAPSTDLQRIVSDISLPIPTIARQESQPAAEGENLEIKIKEREPSLPHHHSSGKTAYESTSMVFDAKTSLIKNEKEKVSPAPPLLPFQVSSLQPLTPRPFIQEASSSQETSVQDPLADESLLPKVPTADSRLPLVEKGSHPNQPKLAYKAVVTFFVAAALSIGLYSLLSNRNAQISENTHNLLGLSDQEIQLSWSSMTPSLMIPVAEAALNAERPNKLAELTIISSAMRGDQISNAVNVGVLRVAFDSRWETTLQARDRRTALALALLRLLKNRLPKDLTLGATLHPGVIFALAASNEKAFDTILKQIPAHVLTHLPLPFGPAFTKFIQNKKDVNCADPALRLLAGFGTRGIEEPGDVMVFLDQDTQARLQSLAYLFSEDNSGARNLLAILFNRPNLRFDYPVMTWAKQEKVKLMDWNEVGDSDRLFVLAGIPPASQVDQGNIIWLFLHPVADIRGYALKEAANLLPFKHPGTYQVFHEVAKKPDMLSPAQTLILAKFLAGPKQARSEEIKQWLEASPPLSLVEQLLVTSAKEPQATRLDLELSRYLQAQGWTPKDETLKKLITHPDDLTRMFAYMKIFDNENASTSFQVLSEAKNTEKNPEFKHRLDEMIATLPAPQVTTQ